MLTCADCTLSIPAQQVFEMQLARVARGGTQRVRLSAEGTAADRVAVWPRLTPCTVLISFMLPIDFLMT